MKDVTFDYRQVNKEKIIDDLLEDKNVSSFVMNHDLTADDMEQHLIDLMTYKREINNCHTCDGLHDCKQDTRGLMPVLRYENKTIQYMYKECPFLQAQKKKTQSENHITSMHLPSSILQASLDDFDFERGKNKTLVLSKMTSFITQYKNKERPLGMYLFGRNNVGKTYVLSALATELIRHEIDVVIAYYPDLVREFKSRVGQNTLESLVSKLKQVDVLMLDDIGGEGSSVWVRDEILGPILQYRLLDKKPTFFSSNLSIKKLVEEHFAKFTKPSDLINATRIGVRIASLTRENEIEL